MRVLHPGRIRIWSVGFEQGENRRSRRKTIGARREATTNSTTNSTNKWHRAGIEPGPHWWDTSTLTTALSSAQMTKGKSPDTEVARNSTESLTRLGRAVPDYNSFIVGLVKLRRTISGMYFSFWSDKIGFEIHCHNCKKCSQSLYLTRLHRKYLRSTYSTSIEYFPCMLESQLRHLTIILLERVGYDMAD